MNTARQIAYKFLSLSFVSRLQVLDKIGYPIYLKYKTFETDMDCFVDAFKWIKENNKLEEFQQLLGL